MAIFYMDPIGGNNANDGTTFANRKRTFNSVTTAAAQGDTIRVIASPDPFSVGSAQWTDNSKAITWTNGSNLKIDGCDSGWTGVTNVTVSHPTDNIEKTGTSYLSLNIAGAFTTGKAAYKTLASGLNVSAFQQVAFYFRTSFSGATINFKVCLCSDTTGNTIVHEMSKTLTQFTDYQETATWVRLTLDNGSAFSSTTINSIAIYLNADAGSGSHVFGFDGFTCCKAPGASDLIDLNSLIGKNTGGEPEWYPVTDLSEAGVMIAGNRLTAESECKPYRGTTESVTTHIRNPLVLVSPWADTDAAFKKDQLHIEGGWNRTDMSTQTGETWISGDFMWTGIYGDSTLRVDANISKIGFVHCTTGAKGLAVGDGDLTTASLYDFLGFIACEKAVTFTATGAGSGWQWRNAGYFKFKCKQVWASLYSLETPSRCGEYTVDRIHGFYYDDGSNAAWTPGAIYEFNPTTYTIGKIDNNKYAIRLDSGVDVRLSGTVLENNTNLFRMVGTDGKLMRLHFDNMPDLLIDEEGYRTAVSFAIEDWPNIVRETRIGGDPTKHRTTHACNQHFETNQTIRHTASGFSWRLFAAMEDPFMFYRPAGISPFPLAQVAVEADKLVTITCWMYIEFDTIDTWWGPGTFPHAIWGIMVQPDAYMGISRIQVEADMEVIATWQQVELTFTPSEAGVVTVYAYAYGHDSQEYLEPPAQYSAYYDDLEVTQEP